MGNTRLRVQGVIIGGMMRLQSRRDVVERMMAHRMWRLGVGLMGVALATVVLVAAAFAQQPSASDIAKRSTMPKPSAIHLRQSDLASSAEPILVAKE
jgi:hypothetical protein